MRVPRHHETFGQIARARTRGRPCERELELESGRRPVQARTERSEDHEVAGLDPAGPVSLPERKGYRC